MALDFVVYGFILLIICILIASKGCWQFFVLGLPVRRQLTIRQNGFIIYQSYVSQSAFKLQLHPTSSNGDLDVTIDERDGNPAELRIPVIFSSANFYNAKGVSKFDLTAGDFRSGNSRLIITPFFFQGTALGGLPQEFTAYGGAQLSANYTALLFVRAGAQPRELGAQCRWM